MLIALAILAGAAVLGLSRRRVGRVSRPRDASAVP
jgi:hypothetical protein